MIAGRRVDLPDRGAAFLLGHAVLGDVGIGADPDIEPPVGAGDEAFGPMVVPFRRKPGDRPRRRGDRGCGRIVGEGDQRVGIGDVERVAEQGHAERRGEAGEVGRPHLRDAVAVAVAQQSDPVRAGDGRAGRAHEDPHEGRFEAALLILRRRRRRGAFGDQHVAIGKHVEPARMIEPIGEAGDAEPCRGNGRRAFGPADGVGDFDGRDQAAHRRRQRRRRPGRLGDVEPRGVAARGKGEAERKREGEKRQAGHGGLLSRPSGAPPPAHAGAGASPGAYRRR